MSIKREAEEGLPNQPKHVRLGDTDINRINATNQYVNITGRILSIRQPNSYTTGKGGTVSSIVLQDKTGTIECSFFNTEITRLLTNLQENKVYNLKKIRPKIIERMEWKKGTVNFSVIANKHTQIEEIPENDLLLHQIPEKQLILDQYSTLSSKVETLVNITGLVIKCGNVEQRNNKNLKEITLSDGEYTTILSLWNEATKQNFSQGSIITIEKTRVKLFRQTINLSGGTITQYKEETTVAKLQEFWNKQDLENLQTITNDSYTHYLSISEAENQPPLQQEFFTVATIVKFCYDNPSYKACKKLYAGRTCNKKNCQRCDGEPETHIQFLSKIQISDYTAKSIVVTAFNNEVEQILGIKTEQIEQQEGEDDFAYTFRSDDLLTEAMKKACYSQLGFWIKMNKDQQNPQETQYVILSIENVNTAKYTKHLKQQLLLKNMQF